MWVKGFTLIEMLLVLMIISVILLLVPFTFSGSTKLYYECEKIVDIIRFSQAKAYFEKRFIEIAINENNITADDKTLRFARGVTCERMQFHFNPRGNISMGNTLTCIQGNHKIDIVMNLGNGHVEIRR